MTLLVTQVMAFPSWLSARTPFPACPPWSTPALAGRPHCQALHVCLSLPTADTHSFPCLSESCPLSRLLLPFTHCPDRRVGSCTWLRTLVSQAHAGTGSDSPEPEKWFPCSVLTTLNLSQGFCSGPGAVGGTCKWKGWCGVWTESTVSTGQKVLGVHWKWGARSKTQRAVPRAASGGSGGQLDG